MADSQLIVLAIGGNALIRDEAHRSVADQWALTRSTCRHIAALVDAGHQLVITHGNGPQVGFILRRSELARHELHEVPLDSCDADTLGAIGYMIQQSLANEFRRRGLHKSAVALVTQVEVDASSPEFAAPSKPIGSFGCRRLVPSPQPLAIVEIDAIRTLVKAGLIVIAVGGGGIPVVRDADGLLQGVEAVIDKDEASSLLATLLHADLLLISTNVDRAYLRFGQPDAQPLDRLSVACARRYLAEGHFGAGSMAPKIHGAIRFIERGGQRAVITSLDRLEDAVAGTAGTRIE